MSTLDKLQQQWSQSFPTPAPYDAASLHKIIQDRVRKHTRSSMHYFWASFALQIGVYALLTHLVVRYWYAPLILLLSLTGILLYLPFTIILLRKFKRLAVGRVNGQAPSSVRDYILQQRALLESFFRFKQRYEIVLIPLISAIGVVLFFGLYLPGGVWAFPVGALLTFLITLTSCYLAIRSENRKSFTKPLRQLNALLEEFQE